MAAVRYLRRKPRYERLVAALYVGLSWRFRSDSLGHPANLSEICAPFLTFRLWVRVLSVPSRRCLCLCSSASVSAALGVCRLHRLPSLPLLHPTISAVSVVTSPATLVGLFRSLPLRKCVSLPLRSLSFGLSR